MNKLILIFLALAAQTAFGLQRVAVPADVKKAVEYIYEEGRGTGDAGGISSIAQYRNSSPIFFAIKDIMFKGRGEPVGIAEIACEVAGKTEADCVRAVLQHDGEVRANYQFEDLNSFVGVLEEWDVSEPEKWADALKTVRQYARRTLGEDYKAYSYGYDDQADVFTVILISKDQKTIVVYTGDYGA
jgi:hypothetical protein